ncbi:uncharacterized protein ARMOST_06053 [Armillaria ostoyae]|uniref:Uncharacterized protein n=1 Tax=Armillaria ostoyae TaxID=47428 RepID=A0A284R1Y6_ARMOS|nr:uncharacterized protein ARMOST_06053 [Armillaria ostoyae]
MDICPAGSSRCILTTSQVGNEGSIYVDGIPTSKALRIPRRRSQARRIAWTENSILMRALPCVETKSILDSAMLKRSPG